MTQKPVKEPAKGILFTGFMAQAVYEGIKTVTRRIAVDAPYSPGDILYVKEPYRVSAQYDALKPSELPDGVDIRYDGLVYDEDEVRGRYRSARFMPRRLARNYLLVKSVTQEPIRAITPAEAIREGFSPYIVDGVLWREAQQAKTLDTYYVHFPNNDHEPTGQRCLACATKFHKANPTGEIVRAIGWDSDGFPGCDGCGRLLDMDYTDYAVDSELEAWEDMLTVGTTPHRDSVYVLWDMIGCNFPEYSTDPDDFGGRVGRLAVVAFRYLWRKLHPKSQPNQLVWRIEFEVMA